MPTNEFVAIPKISRLNYKKVVEEGDSKSVANALLSIAYWDDDWEWVQQQLISFSTHRDCQVLWSVVTGFGFMAVFNGEADLELVVPVLQRVRSSVADDELCLCSKEARDAVSNAIDDSLEDLGFFVKQRREGTDVELGRRLGAE
jgi:hypothetical protein